MNDNTDEIREYYQTNDVSDEIADAQWDRETDEHPMVGITVRLPREVLQRVRYAAAVRGMKTTALIRQVVETEFSPKKQSPAISSITTKYTPSASFRVAKASGGNSRRTARSRQKRLSA